MGNVMMCDDISFSPKGNCFSLIHPHFMASEGEKGPDPKTAIDFLLSLMHCISPSTYSNCLSESGKVYLGWDIICCPVSPSQVCLAWLQCQGWEREWCGDSSR